MIHLIQNSVLIKEW